MVVAAVLLGVAAAAAGAQTPPAERHGSLFPPQDLGLLEGPDREAWQKPDEIMDALGIADGARVADVGPGAGWFTIRLARRVGPNGVVFATDVQRQMLEAVRRRVAREGLSTSRRGSDRTVIRTCLRGRWMLSWSLTRIRKSRIALRSSAISPLPSSLAAASAS